MKTLFALSFVLCTFFYSNAQAPPIQWQKTIGGSITDDFRTVQQCTDGGYILGGYSQSNISGDKTENSQGSIDWWVVKLDTSGVIQWQNTIGGNLIDDLHSIQQTIDGGYILGGYSQSDSTGDKTENSQGGYDYWVVKLDTAGVIQWQNIIGGSADDNLFSIQQCSDAGYILGGYSYSDSTGDKTENSQGNEDYWVVKLDTAGVIQWQNTIGGGDGDYLRSIKQTSDGGYILGGYSYSGSTGDKTDTSRGNYDYWVVKLDSSGAIQWQKTIGGSEWDRLYSIDQTSDGGYILGGYSDSPISGDKTENSQGLDDYWMVKLDAAGAIQWQNTIGGSSDDRLYSIQQTTDGGYVLGGYSGSGISGDKSEISQGGRDYWVVQLDTLGSIQWQNSIGGSGGDYLQSIVQCSDGGYIMGGYSGSGISGDKTDTSRGAFDYWVVKLCNPGNITKTPDETICIGDSIMIFGVYQTVAGTYYNPIPDSKGCDSIIISTTLTIDQLPPVNLGNDTMICNGCFVILDAGNTGSSYIWSTGNNTQTISVNSTGTYWVEVTDTNGCASSDTITIIVASGINELSAFANITIYPNPFSSSAVIELAGGNCSKECSFVMYDVLGRKVREFKVESEKFKVGRGSLRNGMYFYKVTANNETIGMGKLVVAD